MVGKIDFMPPNVNSISKKWPKSSSQNFFQNQNYFLDLPFLVCHLPFFKLKRISLKKRSKVGHKSNEYLLGINTRSENTTDTDTAIVYGAS